MGLLFFLAQRTLIVFFVNGRRSISARDSAMGLAGRGRSHRVPCMNPRDLLVSSITRNERNHIYLLRRVAHVLKTEMVRSVRAIVGF